MEIKTLSRLIIYEVWKEDGSTRISLVFDELRFWFNQHALNPAQLFFSFSSEWFIILEGVFCKKIINCHVEISPTFLSSFPSLIKEKRKEMKEENDEWMESKFSLIEDFISIRKFNLPAKIENRRKYIISKGKIICL